MSKCNRNGTKEGQNVSKLRLSMHSENAFDEENLFFVTPCHLQKRELLMRHL